MSLFVNIVAGKVVCVFLCPQDPEYWPNVREIEEDDPLYKAFLTRNDLPVSAK